MFRKCTRFTANLVFDVRLNEAFFFSFFLMVDLPLLIGQWHLGINVMCTKFHRKIITLLGFVRRKVLNLRLIQGLKRSDIF